MQITQYIDRTPQEFETIEVTTLAVSRLTEAYRTAYKAVFITVEDNSIRYQIDGDDPDAATGHVVIANQNIYFVDPKSLREFRAIAIGGNANLMVTYYI